jgi:hypothetical protein
MGLTGATAGQDLVALYGADPSGLSYASTIDRAVIHKHAVEAVMVTDSLRVGEADFLVAGFLPRLSTPSARAISSRFCRYDFGTLFELVRQATLVVTHQHLEIPSNWATLLFDLALEAVDVSATGPMVKPVKAIIKIHTDVVKNKRGVIKNSGFVMEVFAEDLLIGRASANGQVTTGEKYALARQVNREAMLKRNPSPPTPAGLIDPGLIGLRPGASTLIEEVAAQPEPGHYSSRLTVDQHDLFYYDHPISHVPGIVGAEGLRQAVLAAACAEHSELSPTETFVRRFEGKFTGFLEPDFDLDIAVALGAPTAGHCGTVIPARAVLSQVGAELLHADCEIEFGSGRTEPDGGD